MHDVSPHAATARTPPHRAPRSYPRHDGATGHADSAHDVSPHAATACTPPHRAPRSHPRHDGATGHVTRCTPYRHTPRPHARPSPHRAPHSYPRHDGATGHATRRTPYRRTLRPHAHLPTAPHTATRVTTVAQATRLGTRRIATRLDRTHTSPPRLTQLPAIRRWHMPRDSVHDVSPHAAVARQGRLGLLCAPRTAVALHGCSCVATADHEALVALRICCTRRVRKSSGPRRAAAEHDTSPLRAGCCSRSHRAEGTGTDSSGHLRETQGRGRSPQIMSPRTVTPQAVRAVTELRPQVRMHGHLREMRGRSRPPQIMSPRTVTPQAVRAVTEPRRRCGCMVTSVRRRAVAVRRRACPRELWRHRAVRAVAELRRQARMHGHLREMQGCSRPPQIMSPRTVTPRAVRAVTELRRRCGMHGHLREMQGRSDTLVPMGLARDVTSARRRAVAVRRRSCHREP